MNSFSVILGSTTGLGRALAYELAKSGRKLILLSRDLDELTRNRSDIQIRYNVECYVFKLDLNHRDSYDLRSFFESLSRMTNIVIDQVYILAGVNHLEDDLTASKEISERLNNANFFSIIYFLKMFLSKREISSESGLNFHIASSIAAARTRSNNLMYATSKIALEAYCLGLAHALWAQNIRFQIYRFGYIDSQKSYGKKLPFKAVNPTVVAKYLIGNEKKISSSIVYYPKYWTLISILIRSIPWFLYKKMSF